LRAGTVQLTEDKDMKVKGSKQQVGESTKHDPDSRNSDMLQMLVQNVQDYAITLLDKEGRVLTWSPAAQKLKGWLADEIIGQSFSRFYPAEDVKAGKPQHELEVAAKEGRFEDENWRVRKSSERFWASVVITALRDKDGSLRGFGKLTRDLTDRKQAEEKIKKQAQEILEMATVPVVQVWDGVVLVPLIGTLDSSRTQQLMERLLQRVAESGAPVAVIDITGVPTIDTQTAQHLLETVSAVRLLGADVVLTGVRPTIAQTLVHLGVDLSSVTTCSSLSAGLGKALEILKLKVVSQDDRP
jgi:PAS domain S-box-containing protein